MNNCIHCLHLKLNTARKEFYCQEFSNERNGTIWVRDPESQSCGTEYLGPGTGKFLHKKSHNRIEKLKQLGI
jgi:hypothetical protein